jgi:hypothetical protein
MPNVFFAVPASVNQRAFHTSQTEEKDKEECHVKKVTVNILNNQWKRVLSPVFLSRL